jgi:hypothetical protein
VEVAEVDLSRVVICRHLGDLERLAAGERQGLSSYYQQVEAEARWPEDNEWDELRERIDGALFPGYKDQIRFGALTCSDVGVLSYGAYSLILRTPLVAHRTTVFEENSIVFVLKRSVDMKAKAPFLGFRATWEDRGKLVAAKLAPQVNAATSRADVPGLLLRQHKDPFQQDFVEAHIHGSLTIRTVEHVTLVLPAMVAADRPRKAKLRTLCERLEKYNVTLKEQP